MDENGELENKKKFDQRKKKLVKQMREIDEFTDMS